MRRFASALLVLSALGTVAHAEPTLVRPTFAGIPWGASPADVVRGASAAGLQVVGQDADGDYQFEGQLFGAPATVFAYISPSSGLVKVQVRLASPDEAARSHYLKVIEGLSREYGATESVEVFRMPFQKGDGREDEAVRVGKGLLYASWGDDLQPGQAALVVRATKLVVGLDYESHEWSAEADRRKTRTAGSSL
jgi:hypothetical protein